MRVRVCVCSVSYRQVGMWLLSDEDIYAEDEDVL